MTSPEQLLQVALDHHRAGQFGQAEILYRQILSLVPQMAEAWHGLGWIAHEARQDEAAEELVCKAVQLQPRNGHFLQSLAIVLQRQGKCDEAIECLESALQLFPPSAVAYNNLAEAHKLKGGIRDAIRCYDAALAIQEDFLVGHSNRLMVLHYDVDLSRDSLLAEHLRWAAIQSQAVRQRSNFSNRPDPERSLRIGYVSPDFREHAVARFTAPILRYYDRSRYAVYLYDAHPLDDATSRSFRSMADGYRVIAGLTTDQAVERVAQDEIDILVDLAGHSAYHRLDVFAAKPAPIQVTYLGYPDTTGLRTIDYRISDDIVDPSGEDRWSTEQVWRLPRGFCCFEPPHHAPLVTGVPSLSAGRVTFGCHHALHKLNDALFRCWLKILAAVPGSRILFVRSTWRPAVVEPFTSRLLSLGYQRDQIDFRRPLETQTSYLTPLAEIDICLDSFPYTGHTTTCEALWLGVPVVTLRGDRPAGRASASVLTSAGLERLIADNEQQYIRIATEIAHDAVQRVDWRRTLRQRMAETVCHGPSFCRRLEAAYRQFWHRWCVDRM